MNITTKNIRSGVSVNWQWPVQIGFLNDLSDHNIDEEFNKFHWLSKLAHGYTMSNIRHECNILVLTGSKDKIFNALNEHRFSIKTDLLLFFLDENTKIPSHYKKITDHLKKVSANSFFIAEKENSVSIYQWLEQLIFHLSHNNAIDEAIEKARWKGLLAVTPKLKRESKVDAVFDTMIKNVRKAQKFKNYKVKNVFTDDIMRRMRHFSGIGDESTERTPFRVLRTAKESKEHFRYDHESDESSVLRDISVAHSSNVSDMVEMVGAEKPTKEIAEPSSIRFLQCVFIDAKNEPAHHALIIGEAYNFKVKIDVPDQNWLQAGSVNSEEVPVKKGVEEPVDILLRYNDTFEQQVIMLPSFGSSNEAIFSININNTGETIFQVFAFHKNRLFQQVDISVYACQNQVEIARTPGIRTQLVNMPRGVLSDFDIKEKYGLSIVFSNGHPVIRDDVDIREIRNEVHINNFNDELKQIIESYVTSTNPDHDELILSLAIQGSLLYTNLFQGKGDFDTPIQIISGFTNHFPLEFLYVENLSSETTELCPHASEALKKGTCNGCNDSDLKYICPFGFLCLRTVIERHRVGENVDLLKSREFGLKNEISMHREAIPVLDKTVFATSEKVEKIVSGLRARVSKTLTKFSTEAKEVNTWKDWQKAIEDENPDSLVIIGHVENGSNSATDQLEIGNDLQKKVFINKTFLHSKESKVNPILVLIGCSTQDVDMSFMDFTQHFKNSGAAIVLSTFTKIRGAHAGPIVEKLFEILYSNKGKEIRFGEAMLRLRQQLFAEKLYVSMAMVSHGDADWKLKI